VRLMAHNMNAIIALAALLLFVQPESCLAFTKSSTQLGITDGYGNIENTLNSEIMALIENYSSLAGYWTNNSFSTTTTGVIYSAASGEGYNNSITFYEGEGGINTNGHWFIEDSSQPPNYGGCLLGSLSPIKECITMVNGVR